MTLSICDPGVRLVLYFLDSFTDTMTFNFLTEMKFFVAET